MYTSKYLDYVNAVQYQTGPIHESDNHIFAKIPERGGGVRHTPHPPDPCMTTNIDHESKLIFIYRKIIIITM